MRHRLNSESNVLITGMTGLIGGEIFRRLNARDQFGRLWALIRPSADRDIASRMTARLARSGDFSTPGSHVTPVAGDILEPMWGLSPTVAKDITSSVEVIIHNAADTSFAARRDTAKTNVGSVQRLIELARTCKRDPLIVYMSTASNVGQVSDCDLSEDDGCRPDNLHFNEYTQSKAVGEQLLRASGLPVLILRPTIVLSVGLPDPLFARQILWCAPLGRVFKALPIDPAGRVDIVNVEFVVEATLRLLEKPDRSYDCYNLSAGPRSCVTMGELCDLVDRAYHRRNHLSLVPPAEWTRAMLRENVKTPLQRRVFRSLRHYFPFLNMDVAYNDARLRKDLGSATPRVQPIESYLHDLLRLIREKAALKESALP